MHHSYVPRSIQKDLRHDLRRFPAVALLGPRQCGKSRLAQQLLKSVPKSLYLDLERPSDIRKLTDPELFLNTYRDRLVCLDEIQRKPNLFPILRSLIDERKRNGQFLILGSASRDLIRQSSESLAGRISYLELTPFQLNELKKQNLNMSKLHLFGGFPESFLSLSSKDSFRWRKNFISTFLERDIPQLGFQMPAQTLGRLWAMCAHQHGQQLNQSQLGQSLGLSHTTIRSYFDLFSQTFMVRLLPPFLPNLKKRLVKSPKIFIRDSGILHVLLDIETPEDLFGHPIFGFSWEGFVIENVVNAFPDWQAYFYRTAKGAELDLVLEKGRKRIGIECKASTAPELTPGFWNSLDDLQIDQAWVIAPVGEAFPIKKGVQVSSLKSFLKTKKP